VIPEPFDRGRLRFRPLSERRSKLGIEEIAATGESPAPPAGDAAPLLDELAGEIRKARGLGASVVICHGAHLIKNGCGPVLARLVSGGWLTHVATNGAGSIHDWEFAHHGRSTEDVRAYVSVGEFGLWDETGKYIALALLAGALEGLGYGGSVGKLIVEDRVEVPGRESLEDLARGALEGKVSAERAAAALDLLDALRRGAPGGEIRVAHPWKSHSIQARCREKGIPFTVHPGIGQDIIYGHPLLSGGALGRTSMTDFLLFASAIERLEGGVYLSVGSSVMSPMIFEKSLSMARNVLARKGRSLDDFTIAVNDLARIDWDWSRGEPPMEDPAYYVRFMKSFSRMGGRLRYVGLDNRAFLLGLEERLGRA
jgi:hypothetical protein